MTSSCPCGGLSYETCCKPYIEKMAPAPTPEALMRSRYTAFVRQDIGYLKHTMRAKALGRFDERATKEWMQGIEWLGLTVLDAAPPPAGRTVGFVEFLARFRKNGLEESIHERSRFEKRGGQWLYTDGVHRA